MLLWIERAFSGSCLNVDILSQHTCARQKHAELSSNQECYQLFGGLCATLSLYKCIFSVWFQCNL